MCYLVPYCRLESTLSVEQSDSLWWHTQAGVTTIGVLDTKTRGISEVYCVELPERGGILRKQDCFCSISTSSVAISLELPFSCRIEAFNITLESEPDLILFDPYLHGWLVKVKIDNREPREILGKSELAVRLGREDNKTEKGGM